MRFVQPLSDRDKEQLEKMVREDQVYRVRRRAHTILLSAEGFPIDEIARIYQTDRDTVSSTLTRWESGGVAGLCDEAKSGRPPKLSPAEATEALDALKEDPRSIKKAQAATEKKRTSKSVNGR
jgi:transposase